MSRVSKILEQQVIALREADAAVVGAMFVTQTMVYIKRSWNKWDYQSGDSVGERILNDRDISVRAGNAVCWVIV